MDFNKEIPYIRVGINYYKIVKRPLISGDTIEILAIWSANLIRQDHGADALASIDSYDGFCNIPSHMNYQQVVGGFLNRYEAIPCTPEKGFYPNVEILVRHIFQDQTDLGLDYLTLLYRKPTQMLPVLCLVSRERGTGKTTFLNVLKAIFGLNMTYNKNEDFRSQFNSDWASKLIIAVDEVLLDKKEDSERIKNLSTARTFKAEAKGKDRNEVEFFGKFILCSNNENNFIQIDAGETRYWILKINPFEKEDVFILDKIIKEIPAFLYELTHREVSTPNVSRMWFAPKLLRTPALAKVIHKNKNRVETELLQILSDLIEDYELDSIKMCLADPLPFLHYSGIRYCQRQEIKEIFRVSWGLVPEKNSNLYTKFSITHNGDVYEVKNAKGRFYTIAKDLIDSKLNY